MPGLIEAELRCSRVRGGDPSAVERLSAPFIGNSDNKLGLLRLLRGENTAYPEGADLLSASEALSAKGLQRLSLDPIEKLIGSAGLDRDLREVCLSRMCLTASLHDIPLDLGPLLSELGLISSSPSAASRMLHRRRIKKGHELVDMERELVLGSLVYRRADIVESPSMAEDLDRVASKHFTKAKDIASDLEEEDMGKGWGAYHLARCMMISGALRGQIGLLRRGNEDLIEGLELARSGPFPPLILSILLEICSFAEKLEGAEKLLDEAHMIADELENTHALARIAYIHGSLVCLKGEGDEKMRKGRILKGAKEILLASDRLGAASHDAVPTIWRTEAAVWLIRAGEPEKALKVLRGCARGIRALEDRGLLMELLSASVYARLSTGDRRGGKKALLDLLYNHPVKNDVRAFNLLKEAVEGHAWLREDEDTRELFEGEVVYRIDRCVIDDIIRRAKGSYPNEFGAMLRGVEHITRLDPIMEGAGGRTQFMFSLYSRFSGRNVEGEGVVHSHPSGSARPSRADLSMFGRFPGINIIIGHPFRDDSMAAYDRLGNRVRLDIIP